MRARLLPAAFVSFRPSTPPIRRSMTTMAYPAPVVVKPTEPHTASCILLHGLGDRGESWAPVVSQLRMPHVKFIFPTAPTRPITLNGGAKMPGWFDLLSLSAGGPEDRTGILNAVAYVNGLIDAEEALGIPRCRICLAGFSQGGAVALQTAVRSSTRLAGVLAMSTWLADADAFPAAKGVGAANLPIFFLHGEADMLVAPSMARESHQRLKQLGCSVQFQIYKGVGHDVSPQGLADAGVFLRDLLPKAAPTAVSYTSEDIDSMSIKQLKDFITGRAAKHTDCLEKADLLERAKSLL